MQTATELQKVMAVKTPNVIEAELRRALREAIDVRKQADCNVNEVKQIADKAAREVHLANEAVERLKAAQEQADSSFLQEHAIALTKALRMGLVLPATPAPAAADRAALASAEGRQRALAKAAALLVKDYETASAEAARAAERVRIKANAVMDCVGHRIVSELIAARDIFWKLQEVVSGFFLFDDHRQAPKFTPLKNEVKRSLDRQTVFEEASPQNIELHNWMKFVDMKNRDNWGRWQDFGRALEDDADAFFDAYESEPRH